MLHIKWLVIFRMAVDVGKSLENNHRHVYRYGGMMDCLRQVFKEGGFPSIYKGFSITVFGTVIFKALHLGGYEIVKETLNFQRSKITFAEKFIAAQVRFFNYFLHKHNKASLENLFSSYSLNK